MKKSIIKVALFVFFLNLTSYNAQAQNKELKVGINPTVKAPSAVLEVENPNKGALLPRVALSSIIVAAPITAPANALTVFNTATAGVAPNNVTPGYYYWSTVESKWIRLLDQNNTNEPWRVQASTNQATANAQNIYQTGSVAVGDFSGAASTKKMEVKGDFKAEASAGTAIFGTEINSPLVPPGLQNVANYWVNAAEDYRASVVHANAAAISAGTEGTNPNSGVESIIAVDNDRATIGSRFKNLSAKSEIRSDKTGNFYLEAYDTAPALNYASTVSLQDDGLRMVHSTTQGAGPNWLSTSNRSEIFVQKANGVRFAFRNSAGTQTAEYWFPTTTGTDGQVLTRNSIAGRTEWRSPSTFGAANNGLTKNVTNGDFELGGTLNRTTTIATVNGVTTHPLNITGLPTGATTDNVVLSSTGGQLKTILTANLVQEPWNVIGSPAGTQATTNAQNIYQMGNVAIGATSAPSFLVGATTVQPKFHVAGDVSTTGKIYTTNSVYADYVFEKYFLGNSEINPNYEFKSLNYVKDFIKANHHLPGVESIDDLKKAVNGYTFDMTKLTIQSLEKIEELYIHTIEQKDKIDAQQTEIEKLKKDAEETKSRLERLEKLLLENNK